MDLRKPNFLPNGDWRTSYPSVLFNQPYLKNKLIQHQECIIFGKWDAKRSTLMGMKIISTKEDVEENVQF